MTQQYDRTNTGIVGKNTKKEKDTHPDITGSINVEGKEFWLNGWKKERNDGTGSFYSLSVKPKEQQQAPAQQQHRPAQQAPAADDFDDSIPF
jgi:ribosome modulation factor